MKARTSLAVAACAAALLAVPAGAAPTASWSNFTRPEGSSEGAYTPSADSGSTDGYAITVNGTPSEDGSSVELTTGGIELALPEGKGTFTVVVDLEGLPTDSDCDVLVLPLSNNNTIKLLSASQTLSFATVGSDGTTTSRAENGGTAAWGTTARRKVSLTHKNSAMGTAAYLDGNRVVNDERLRWSGATVSQIQIVPAVASGVKVYGVSIYDSWQSGATRFFEAPEASSEVYEWAPGNDNNWSTAANWKLAGSVCGAAPTGAVRMAARAGAELNVDVKSAEIAYLATAGAFTLSGTGAVELADTAFDGAVTFTAKSVVWEAPDLYKEATPKEIPTQITLGSSSTLSTKGYIQLTNAQYDNVNANLFQGDLIVSSGCLWLTARKEKGIEKSLTINAGAKCLSRVTDPLNVEENVTVDVYGVLDFQDKRWTFGKGSTNTTVLNCYTGAELKGNGENTYGAIDINYGSTGTRSINFLKARADEADGGIVKCSAKIRPRGGEVNLNVAKGVTLELSGAHAGDNLTYALAKSGDGTLKVTSVNFLPASDSQTPIKVKAGDVLWRHNGNDVSISNAITVETGATFAVVSDYKYDTSFSGTLSGGGTIRYKVPTAGSQFDGARILTLSGDTSAFTGQVELELTATSSDDKPRRTKLNLSPSNGQFGGSIAVKKVDSNFADVADDTAVKSGWWGYSGIYIAGDCTIGGGISGEGKVYIGKRVSHAENRGNADVETDDAGRVVLTGGSPNYKGTCTTASGSTLVLETPEGTETKTFGDSAVVQNEGTVELSSGFGYFNIRGTGTTKVTGTGFFYGIGSNTGNTIATPLEVVAEKSLKLINWNSSGEGLTPASLTLRGKLVASDAKGTTQYPTYAPKVTLKSGATLSGDGVLDGTVSGREIALAFRSGAVIDATAGAVTCSGAVTLPTGESETVTVKANAYGPVLKKGGLSTEALVLDSTLVSPKLISTEAALVVTATPSYTPPEGGEALAAETATKVAELAAAAGVYEVTSVTAESGREVSAVELFNGVATVTQTADTTSGYGGGGV